MHFQKVLTYGVVLGAALIIINALAATQDVAEIGSLVLIASFLVVVGHLTALWLLLQPIAGIWPKLKAGLLFGLSAFVVYGVWIVALFPVVFPDYYDEAKQAQIALYEEDETLTTEQRELLVDSLDTAASPVATAFFEFFSLVIMSGIYSVVIALLQKTIGSSDKNRDKEILGNSDSVFDS